MDEMDWLCGEKHTLHRRLDEHEDRAMRRFLQPFADCSIVALAGGVLRLGVEVHTPPDRKSADRRCELQSEWGEDPIWLLQDFVCGKRVVVYSTIRLER